jgi:hypothetical protein
VSVEKGNTTQLHNGKIELQILELTTRLSFYREIGVELLFSFSIGVEAQKGAVSKRAAPFFKVKKEVPRHLSCCKLML